MEERYFNDGWRFQKDGGAWQEVLLPHDAMLYNERTPESAGGPGQAYFTGGSYVYEKRFERPVTDEGAPLTVLLAFEGVYRNAKVYINGQLAKEHAYGYMPFQIDADPFLKDGENLLRVECENKDLPSSRWYDGAGIYRPVHLWCAAGDKKDALLPGSVRVRTVKIEEGEVIDGRATVNAELLVESDVPAKIEILDGWRPVATGEGTKMTLHVEDARLWDDEAPNLYNLYAESYSGDTLSFEFGIRTLTWDHTNGLMVNGKTRKLRGGCVHHDNGILGAACVEEAEWQKVKTLKDAGFNAIRSAHNPASRALLAACDALGMYVMDEAWDTWYTHKRTYDYASFWRENWEEDVKRMVRRDFNHPSVVMYSIGNELTEPGTAEGLELEKQVVALFHAEDPTRPTTDGFNLFFLYQAAAGAKDDKEKPVDPDKLTAGKEVDAAVSPAMDLVDIAGYNYAYCRYEKDGKLHPDRIIVGSETFPAAIVKNWKMVREKGYLVGDFMWTSWDYLGEAGAGAWTYGTEYGFEKPYPWKVAKSGVIDIIGTEGAEAAEARAAWGLQDTPYIAVRPVDHTTDKVYKSLWRGTDAIASWSWKGLEGKPADVEVYVNEEAAKIVLSVNGKVIGKQRVKDCKASFRTTYTPGTIEAVAFTRAGKEISRSCLKSANPATTEVRISERGAVPGAPLRSFSPRDVFFYDVQIADAEGVVESHADRKLALTVENGTLVAFGSALPETEESFTTGVYTTYHGRALAAVRPEGSEPVKISVKEI